ncbi:uncharacterized protein LOC107037357 [Diachasma alloeum]|uniref:uncharacterized protein LOC107037357 n=1 Tax=Diachasma alloeum TaxID=454923 RepID=UPI00073850D8|nr:uncharacterized protein LOC107037357 [Diachasma alloeum]
MSKDSLKRSHDEAVSSTSSSSSISNDANGTTGDDPTFTLTPSTTLQMYNNEMQSRLIPIVGVVDQIFPGTSTAGAVAKTIFKWTVNNGDGERVECVAWNIQVQRIQSHIVLGNVLFLNGVFMKAGNVTYLNGTVLFQLTVQSNTTCLVNSIHTVDRK